MMKTKVAMAISLAGVLAAGTAAALVNTHVLNGGAGSSVGAESPAVEQTSPAADLLPDGSVPTTLVIAQVPPAPAGPAAPTQATYAIGDAGSVTLDTAGDALTIVSTAPAAGWVVTQQETGDHNSVEVKFQSGSVEVEFQANLLYGIVNTSVETHDLSASSTSVSGGDDDHGDNSGRGGGDDDGDHGSDHGGDDD